MNKKTLLLNPSQIDIAADIIKRGGLVAFPTETVYGLGADALNDDAVRSIFKAKKRPMDNPLIVHISSIEQLNLLAEKIPKKAKKLAERFWPGPLTMILKKKSIVPLSVTAGLDSVAIRMPKNDIALALIEKSGRPIAAPSANLSGRPSPTNHSHVIDDLSGRIDAIILGGSVDIGLESTVIDMTRSIPTILRPGKITPRMIQNQIGFVSLFKGTSSKPASPGMKYRHYSPKAKVILVKYSKHQKQKISELIADYQKGNKILVLSREKIPSDSAPNIKNVVIGSTIAEMSNAIFKEFREADKEGDDIIIVEGTKETGLGIALMNRLGKAASIIVK